MNLTKVLSGLSFLAALAIGILSSSFLAIPDIPVAPCAEQTSASTPIFGPAPVRAEDMVGVWKGTWGYNRAACAITIERVNGEKFYGKLHKGGAEIALVGTLDPNSRTISFKETKVLRRGEYTSWSLGTNTGSFSLDGRTLAGTGTDENGMYFWDASKD